MSRTLKGRRGRRACGSIVLALGFAIAAVGCGGEPGGTEQSASLQKGVYTYVLSESYLLENGISKAQSADESGIHTVTVVGDGSFRDAWRTAQNRTGSCRGTYEEGDGGRLTFSWTSGCFGDFEATYEVDGDRVTWSDAKALPPWDQEEDQKVAKAFMSVPWIRTGDVPQE